MRIRQNLLPLGCLVLLVCLTSCFPEGYYTILWRDVGSNLLLKTNDIERCGSWFSYTAAYEPTMTTVEVSVVKMSGCPSGPYGFLFCSTDPSNYYYLYINALGKYTLGKVVNGSGSVIQDWTYSPWIEGLTSTNILKITYNGSNSFTFSANSTPIMTFSDPSFSGGYEVLVASVMPEELEYFPEVPEEYLFWMTSPVSIPGS